MKSKKSLVALVGLLTVTALGSTFAYFSQDLSATNEFKTGKYDTEITETFTPPENWVPGVEVEKSVLVTNTGNVPVVVRASFDEAWVKEGAVLDGTFLDKNEVKQDAAVKTLGEVVNYEDVAINLSTASGKWVAVNGNYYFIGLIAPNNGTSKELLKSVTLHPELTAGITNKDIIGGSTVAPTTATGANYDDAKYTLKVNATTVQATQDAVKATFTSTNEDELKVIGYIMSLCGADVE